MEFITCNDSNNNIEFLIDLIKGMQEGYHNSYWVISDLDLIPLFHGDYKGDGGVNFKEIAYSFNKRVEKEKVVILNYNELMSILNDAQTVRRAVLVCFSSDFSIDTDSFRPLVEPKNPNILSNDNAKYELRILDGGLFIILKNNTIEN